MVTDRQPGGSQDHDGDGADEHIADVFDPSNAALIAAAPDLLAVCEYMVKVPSRLSGEQLAKVKAAIAQARA